MSGNPAVNTASFGTAPPATSASATLTLPAAATAAVADAVPTAAAFDSTADLPDAATADATAATTDYASAATTAALAPDMQTADSMVAGADSVTASAVIDGETFTFTVSAGQVLATMPGFMNELTGASTDGGIAWQDYAGPDGGGAPAFLLQTTPAGAGGIAALYATDGDATLTMLLPYQ